MRKWLPLLAICLGNLMLLIDVTIVNVALPDMVTDLGASFSQLQWVIDIYALALAALLLGVGSFSDLVGRKPVYIGGLVLFAVASLGAGLSGSTDLLIVARGVQGVGAAAMFATTIALISTTYDGRDRAMAFGIWGAINGAAAALGPILGGVLTQGLSWRWIFFVNLPISVVAVVLSARVLVHERPQSRGRVDMPGVAAFTVAAGAVTLALTRASDNGWTSATTLGLLAGGVVALVGFLVIEHVQTRPVLELSLLRRPAFSGVLIGSLLLTLSAFAYLTYVSLWLQSVRGMSPIHAGLSLIPLSLAALVVAPLAGRHLSHVSPRWTIGGGLALIGLGALAEAHVHAHSSASALLPGLLIAGAGVGLATPVLASAALAAVPPERGGMAAGAVNTTRQLGYALGIAVLGLICQSRIGSSIHGTPGLDRPGAAREITGGQTSLLLAHTPGARRASIGESIHHAFASGLDVTMLVAGGAGLVGAALVITMLRPGRERASAPAPETGRIPLS